MQVNYRDGKQESKLDSLTRPGLVHVVHANGDVFDGVVILNNNGEYVPHGKGKYTWKNGAIYEGEYDHGVKSGLGSYRYPNGTVYRGSWKNGHKSGPGTVTYTNGDSFSGMFADDMKNGKGCYTYASTGAKLNGEWHRGDVIHGKWIFPAGMASSKSFRQKSNKEVIEFVSPQHPVSPSSQENHPDKPLNGSDSIHNVLDQVDSVQNSIGNIDPISASADAPPLPDDSSSNPLPPLGVIIAGAPASGKGTQCEKIREEFGLVHLSTGDMLRAAVAAGTDVGKKAKEIMETGGLVPDEIVIGAIKERLAQPDVQEHGFLLDGFPRTSAQAEALLNLGLDIHAFLMLEVPDDLILERVTGRRIDPDTGNSYHLKFKPPPEDIEQRLIQRKDDTEECVKPRLQVYHENIDSVRRHFEEVLLRIDGTGKPHEVWETITNHLNSVKQSKS